MTARPDALDTGGPQGPPPTSPSEKSGSGGGGAGVDLDRLAALIHDALKSGELAAHWDAYGCNDDAVAALDVLVARVRVLDAGVEMHVAALDSLETILFGDCWRRSRDEMEARAAALAAAGGGPDE